jgi:hypothetical protein
MLELILPTRSLNSISQLASLPEEDAHRVAHLSLRKAAKLLAKKGDGEGRHIANGDGSPDDAVEGYAILREALAKTGKVAIGQLVMGGSQYIVGIMPKDKGLMLVILRYADEARDRERFFDSLDQQAQPQAWRWRRS